MSARVYPIGLGEPTRYPERELHAANKSAALKGAVIVHDQDGRGEDAFIVAALGRTRVFLQLSDAVRFVETLPRHVA